LQEAVNRRESTRARECQNEPRAAVFESIEDQHCNDGEEAEKRESGHGPAIPRRGGRRGVNADPIADAAQAPLKAPTAAAQVEMIVAAARNIRDIGILLWLRFYNGETRDIRLA
jgi:hypothetical protein